MTWVEEQVREWIDAMPPDEQAALIARSGDPREGQGYGKRGLGGMGAERQA